jgi:hypothetical protein
MSELQRINAVAQVSMRPGFLRFETELPAIGPGESKMRDDVPCEVAMELVPADLRDFGARFTIVFEAYGPVIAVERI